MNRITYITLHGARRPLNFSVRAAMEVTERFGGVEQLFSRIGAGAEQDAGDAGRLYQETVWLLALLLREGAAYDRLFGNDAPAPLTEEALSVLLGVPEVAACRVCVLNAVLKGMEATVEVEPDRKNVEATQSGQALRGSTTMDEDSASPA